MIQQPGHGGPAKVRRALVIGFGSIGRRHAEILAELGCMVGVVSRRNIDAPIAFSDIGTALAAHAPEYIVVANETDQHFSTLSDLARLGYKGTLVVEKPVFMHDAPMPPNDFSNVYVAYNLRFHPIIARLNAVLKGQRIVSVQAYVGQYLPDWRPQTDYRLSYSASAERGGGVLRDLSHELDYLTWLLGGWQSVAALGGQFSALEIDSEDICSLLMTTPLCPVVSVQLNYLDRIPKRLITINTDSGTIEADLIKGTLSENGCVHTFGVERNTTYRAMHLEMLAGAKESACSLPDGVRTLGLIEAAVKAANLKIWIEQ